MSYNGWKNYETFVVSAWLNNDEHTQRYWRDAAQECREAAPTLDQVAENIWTIEEAAKFTLADRLKEEIENGSTLEESSLYADLLNAAISEVDWHELADGFLEE